MGKTLPGVLMFLLVILKVLGTAETTCRCTSASCDCSSLGLTSVPQDLPTTITDLDLEQNRITTLSQSDFSRYRNLETLRLKNNSISTINDQTFYYLSHLVTLDLRQNSLISIRSDMFTGLENLRYLYLHDNDITDIEAGTFSPTPQLRYLSINNNKLTILRSDMFTGLGHLESLCLYDNMINNIQVGTFDSLPQLRILSLRNNNITMFHFEELVRYQMISLDLGNNQLTTLSSAAYDTLSSIFDVNIENNPCLCDCRMVDFRLKMTGYLSVENSNKCFNLLELIGVICGPIFGTLFIVAIILTIWGSRRNNNSPLERPDNSVVFNNSNTTAVITRFHSRKEQSRPHSNPERVASTPAEYETVKPCPEKPRPRSADPMVACGRTNESNYYNERPPLPLPRTTDNDDSLHQYQSLRKTDTESVDDYETPHDYVTLP